MLSIKLILLGQSKHSFLVWPPSKRGLMDRSLDGFKRCNNIGIMVDGKLVE